MFNLLNFANFYNVMISRMIGNKRALQGYVYIKRITTYLNYIINFSF